jgi:predicted Zn-dependent protease/transglutaminase-like putative cysteine protease
MTGILCSLVLLLAFRGYAQQPGTSATAKPAPSVPIDYTDESYVIQKYSTDVTYAADGTGDRLITVQLKVQSEAAVRQFGVLEFSYESRNEHVDFNYVRVRKPDGSVIATPETDAQDQPAEVTREAPFYSDLRAKQLPVKSLSVGDQLEYQIHQVRTVAAAPGQFWYTQTFVRDAVVLQETASLNVPKSKYVQVESATVKPQITEHGDRKIYTWTTAQLERSKPSEDKPKKQPITETPPSIAVTTFKNWEEVGHWYGDLQKDRIVVTPAIQAKANELTSSSRSDQEKVAALYTYVATQYRYIGVAFGIGRYQPHSADEVMQNQYGDCKDKHTLLATLLKAAGYDAWPVLLGSAHVLDPAVPSPGQFDHVMTAVTLNKAGMKSVLWMDSTPEVAPFQLLFYALRDKLVLAIPSDSIPVLMKTPANPPFEPFDKYEAKATLATDGTLNGRFDLSLRSDTELLYRMGFHRTSRVQWSTLMQNVSYAAGFSGTVSNVTAGSPEKLDVPFQISYEYTRKKYADWDNHRILPLMPHLAFSYNEDDSKPVDTILLGGPSNIDLHTTIALPSNYTAELPAPVNIHAAFADYATTYSQSDGNLTVHRTIHIGPREIPVAQWDDYLKFEKAVVADEDTYIQLQGPADSNPEANALVRQAYESLRAHDLAAARTTLDRAAKINPAERGLWSAYGLADIDGHHPDDAIKAYKKEIEDHPEVTGMYLSLAGLQQSHQDAAGAVETLRELLKVAPADVAGHQALASLLISQKRYAEAIPVLQEAVAQSPEVKGFKVMLGSAQIGSGAKENGVATLREVLADASDESILNDAAYSLADAGLELTLARASCEKALRQLDGLTSKAKLAEISDNDLHYVTHLAATWDTMAWILYRQGDLEAAEDYAKAAWALDQRPAIGQHLGEIYEKRGKKVEAIHAFQLAIAASPGQNADAVEAARTHLRSLNVADDSVRNDGSFGEELGKLRSVDTQVTGVSKGSADFFLLMSPGPRLDGVRFVTGDASLKDAGNLLDEARFNQPFPAGSGARLLRRGILFCSPVLKSCQFTLIPPEAVKKD